MAVMCHVIHAGCVMLQCCVMLYMQVVSCCSAVSCYTCRLCHVAVLCHAIHAGNFSSELTCLTNLEMFVNPSTLPLLPQLLSRFHFHFLRLLFLLFFYYDNLRRIMNPMIMLSITFFDLHGHCQKQHLCIGHSLLFCSSFLSKHTIFFLLNCKYCVSQSYHV